MSTTDLFLRTGISFPSRYTNVNGTLYSVASFWRTVAKTFSNRSSVLGYELINEPPFPDLIEVLGIGQVDRVYLAPMYKKLHEVIRQVDDEQLDLLRTLRCRSS